MDALKFAFETLIVGALAVPWLLLFLCMFFERPPTGATTEIPFFSAMPPKAHEVLSLALVIGIGYFLGAAVSRIASDFLDDEDVLWKLPTEGKIRQEVYYHEYCHDHSVLEGLTLPSKEAQGHHALFCTPPSKLPKQSDERRDRMVAEFFHLQESKLLLIGDEKTSRIRGLHDQIGILRGATLNFAVLLVLACFGLSGQWRTSEHPIRVLASYLPALAILAAGVGTLVRHVAGGAGETFHDPPLAEIVLILLGLVGFAVTNRCELAARWFTNGLVAGVPLTVVAYCAWWWTEVLYDQQIIHSLPNL